jgi:hypothetical protein
MWLYLLLLLVVVGILLLLNQTTPLKLTRQGAATVTKPSATSTGLVSGRYRIWVPGQDDNGDPGRYYMVAYGVGRQQSSVITDAANIEGGDILPPALNPVGGTIFFYFRPEGDVGDLNGTNIPLYLAPIGGIANTAFTDYFNVQVLKDKLIFTPSGPNFAGAVVSVCNDPAQCIPKLMRFSNSVGGTVFNYEAHDDGYRVYQDGEPKDYVIVGNPICPAGALPEGAAKPIMDAYNFVVTNCASLPANQPGGPRMAIVSPASASSLHFTK